jgi:hypothetical protein
VLFFAEKLEEGLADLGAGHHGRKQIADQSTGNFTNRQ